MSMPSIPRSEFRPSIEETMIDLLDSIALEEIALSRILNAQGEKMQAAIKEMQAHNITADKMEQIFAGSGDLLVDVVMKEWLLLTKLNKIREMSREYGVTYRQSQTEHIAATTLVSTTVVSTTISAQNPCMPPTNCTISQSQLD